MNKFLKILLTILLTICIIAVYFCFFQLLRGLLLQDEELIFVYGFSLMGSASTLWMAYWLVRLLYFVLKSKKDKKEVEKKNVKNNG